MRTLGAPPAWRGGRSGRACCAATAARRREPVGGSAALSARARRRRHQGPHHRAEASGRCRSARAGQRPAAPAGRWAVARRQLSSTLLPRHAAPPSEISPTQKQRAGSGSWLRLQKPLNFSSTPRRWSVAICMALLKLSTSWIPVVTASIRGTGASRPSSRCPLPRPRSLILAPVALKMPRVPLPPWPMIFLARSKPRASMHSSRNRWHHSLLALDPRGAPSRRPPAAAAPQR
mmetsp:Transcript_92174/g.250097  ORF Transcript_92174/g.250097 Transcript_92174/m.250097 type:complete len:233 (-) Transcript_92174:108-806(-)